MTRLPRRWGEWRYAAVLPLLISLFAPAPSSLAGENNPYAGLSDHLLIPENPYVFTQSITFWKGFRQDELEPGAGAPAGSFDFFELGLEADLHWDRLNAIGSVSWGWDGDQDAESADFLGGVGYDFALTVTGIRFTPLAGWAGSHLDCDARFDTEWAGPFLGAKLEIPLAERWLLQAGYFYRWAAFEAEMPTAITRADGGGHTGRLDLVYQLNERIDLKLGAALQSFSADPVPASALRANWESWSVGLGVSVKF